jgi:hypothetical protein
MKLTYNEDEGYDFDQELAIEEMMLREHGMASVSTRRRRSCFPSFEETVW